MASRVFDIINSRFFFPLSNGQKELNHELLDLLNTKMKNDMSSFSREDVIGWIVECLENHKNMLFVDDDTLEDEGSDYQTIASNKLRYFIGCGWIIEETDNKTFTTTYQMDSSAISVLSALSSIVQNDTKPVEYTGYVSNIYNNLKNFDFSHGIETLEQIDKLSNDLMDNLRGLNGDIKKYLRKIINSDDITPNEIMHQLFDLYQSKVIVKNFNNLRRKDNPAKYKDSIIDNLERLLNIENMSSLIADYCSKKINHDPSDKDEEEARYTIQDIIYSVITRFESIDEYLERLDNKNVEYLTAASSRLKFLINENGDMEGMLIGALKLIAKTGDKFDEQDFFRLYQLGKTDENSLFVQGARRKKVLNKVKVEEISEEDELEFKKQRQRLLRDTEFNVASINRFIERQLGNRISIEAKAMTINGIDDLFKVFLAAVYSENAMVTYKLTLKDDSFIYEGREIGNYLIERRSA